MRSAGLPAASDPESSPNSLLGVHVSFLSVCNNVSSPLWYNSRDIGRIWKVAEALEYGIVSINNGLPTIAEVPFGGVKESGMGREGSRYGLDDYLTIKYISMGGI